MEGISGHRHSQRERTAMHTQGERSQEDPICPGTGLSESGAALSRPLASPVPVHLRRWGSVCFSPSRGHAHTRSNSAAREPGPGHLLVLFSPPSSLSEGLRGAHGNSRSVPCPRFAFCSAGVSAEPRGPKVVSSWRITPSVNTEVLPFQSQAPRGGHLGYTTVHIVCVQL